MTQSHRLAQGGLVDRSQVLTFTFNGRRYTGHAGDTLASALLANGVHFVARSWKYHRPRGILTAGVDEPNALVQLEVGAITIPNVRATEALLYDGLVARSVNAEPDIERDRMAITGRVARFVPAGFYYKTFMWPRTWWPRYEHFIRQAAGLGHAPTQKDPDRYEKTYAHCDVLVVGAGPAGLAAARVAGEAGARVLLVDDRPAPGGSLPGSGETIDGAPAERWIAQQLQALQAMPEVQVLSRTTAFGYHDHNLVVANQKCTDHLPPAQRRGPRERLWKIRAQQVVLATGAHERPLVFGNNDLPGVMLASAVTTYVQQYGVLPGRQAVLFTNNDSAYAAALAVRSVGGQVTVVDARPEAPLVQGSLPAAARLQGIEVLAGAVVSAAAGSRHVRAVAVCEHRGGGVPGRTLRTLACDLVMSSGGWNPVIHLFAQSGGKAQWDEARACFVPGASRQAETSVGACAGAFGLDAALQTGVQGAVLALQHLGLAPATVPAWHAVAVPQAPLLPLWLVGERATIGQGAKPFVDFQNDVTAADIQLAAREGYTSVEHVKRYTAMGFGTDQGKLGNINGMAILAETLGQTIPETGTTTYRPNYTPVSFGVVAGRELGELHDPVRKTCVHDWHAAHGALFEDVGNWKRPWYYPRAGEDLHAAVRRECLAVREGVGLLDASTLGKIDVQGRDAATLLNWVYTNPWSKLEIGKCRYGLMLDENGMVFDDGVTVRLGEHHFLMSTTTGGAARVLTWMERWLQTEWPHLDVRLTSVTDHFATFAVAGPKARAVLRQVCDDIDFTPQAFPFMSFREGTVAGIPARVMRISFSGELGYEVNVPANHGAAVWQALCAAGEAHGITPYGTETMHVLRAEKGFIIVGQDTDGSVTPHDLGMGGLVAKTKDFLGKRSLTRTHTAQAGRKQFVGLLAEDPALVLPEGSQIVSGTRADGGAAMVGHVTSSYWSPVLKRSIALALLAGGQGRMGEVVQLPLVSGAGAGGARATVVSPVFYDAEGTRQHVE